MIRSLVFSGGENTSQTFNITYGNSRTIKELFDIVARHLPSAKSEVAERSIDKPSRGTLSIKRAREILDFKPKWCLENGYENYINWFKGMWQKKI